MAEKKYNRVPRDVFVKVLDLLRARANELKQTRPLLTKLAPEIGKEVGFPHLSPGTLREIRNAAGVTWEPRTGPACRHGKRSEQLRRLEERADLAEKDLSTCKDRLAALEAAVASLRADLGVTEAVLPLRTPQTA